ncbi:hypothetical protein B296_00022929 [Ensete ventricosum]|uniref:Uncharacterized protein n=1 Tax=Ensete ventricosum TaxID=4639 RepID=A0A426ZAE2_ENSVE|nr:hypothetical protein B296_00022929 [Ensete ventricosum]
MLHSAGSVVNTLREYAIKAVVNTVDHLGSVSFKVAGLLEAKVDEVSGAESRVSFHHPFFVASNRNVLSFVQYSSSTQKSASMRLHAERNDEKDGEQNPSKGKKFLMSLLSRRKSKKDEMVYSYLDEY